MKKLDLITAGIGLISIWLLSAPLFCIDVGRTELLRREIRTLNLVNGLELTQGQMKKILGYAEEVDQFHQQIISSRQKLDEESTPVLEEIKAELIDKKDVSKETAQNFHQLTHQAKVDYLKAVDKIRGIAKEVQDLLKSHQIHQIDLYIPCVIPPKGELRIGQAKDYKGVFRRLDQIRNITYRVYEKRKDMICRRTLQGIRVHNPKAKDMDEKITLTKIAMMYDRTRRMNDVEFEIQKQDLAEEFMSILKPQKHSGKVLEKIEKFLLSPEIIPLLRERLETS